MLGIPRWLPAVTPPPCRTVAGMLSWESSLLKFSRCCSERWSCVDYFFSDGSFFFTPCPREGWNESRTELFSTSFSLYMILTCTQSPERFFFFLSLCRFWSSTTSLVLTSAIIVCNQWRWRESARDIGAIRTLGFTRKLTGRGLMKWHEEEDDDDDETL